MNSNNLLIIFTKNPVEGKVKTRLAKDIGAENALKIYEILLRYSKEVTTPLEVTRQVYYSEEIPEKDLWSGKSFTKKLQSGKDLGERMENAFAQGFAEGFDKIVIIGTDLFELETKDLESAFIALDDHDYVIGPAQDGGYYLLGMKSLNSEIFKNKQWSTSSVFNDTLKDLEGATVKILETQNDIDVLEDIKDHPDFQNFIKYDRQN